MNKQEDNSPNHDLKKLVAWLQTRGYGGLYSNDGDYGNRCDYHIEPQKAKP